MSNNFNKVSLLIHKSFDDVHHNQKQWDWYQNQLQSLPSYSYTYQPWRQYERELCSKVTLKKPTCSITILFELSYVSPAGRSKHRRIERYSEQECLSIEQALRAQALAQVQRQNEIAIERMKVTPGLRYDILKRDGFKCVLCGSTAKDGVKLHVDHIVPLSRGGKTEMANLRTLCDRCNLGKGAKME